jgi:hypothetical protein
MVGATIGAKRSNSPLWRVSLVWRSDHDKASRSGDRTMKNERRLTLLCAVLFLTTGLSAQFGGTGGDGVFRPLVPTTLDTNARPGGWDFTTIDIPAGVTVRLQGTNPAIIRCQGTVRIDGQLRADGFGANGTIPGAGGPGGYAGGSPGQTGSGPAGGVGGSGNSQFRSYPGCGGHATPGQVYTLPSGPPTGTYGSDFPFDLRGGSGGGGFSSISLPSYGGSGGGGVVVIAADGSITIDGAVTADGAGDGSPGSGAGGGVWLRSATNVTIRGRVSADGPRNAIGPLVVSEAGDGFVRIDAWGEPPVLTTSATLVPTPRAEFLPILDTTDPAIGSPWFLRVSTLPVDDVAWFLGAQQASIPLPGLGVLELDPGAGILLLGASRAGTGVTTDSNAQLRIDIPASPALRGVVTHVQAIAFQTSSSEGPHLSASRSATIP